MAFKLDISKAYDKMEWVFLEAMLRKLGFCEDWVALVMSCVHSVRYNVLINDDLVWSIEPSRGLWERDPLSPYLFILCAEGLPALLNKFVAEGSIHRLKIARDALIVSHLFFADDAYLFFQATLEECIQIKFILQLIIRRLGKWSTSVSLLSPLVRVC